MRDGALGHRNIDHLLSCLLDIGMVQPTSTPIADHEAQKKPAHNILEPEKHRRKATPFAQPPDVMWHSLESAYLVDDEYLVTALVPSDTACLASSPGRMSRTLP